MIYGSRKDFEKAQKVITEQLKQGKTEGEALAAGLRSIKMTECEKCLSQYACSHASPECDCEND